MLAITMISINATKFKELMIGLRFSEVSLDLYPKYFDTYEYYFENQVVLSRLTRDRGGYENVCFQSKADRHDQTRWFDLHIINCFLENRSDLTFSMSIDDQLVYLEKNSERILSLFSTQSYNSTRTILDNLRDQRGRQLFPESFRD